MNVEKFFGGEDLTIDPSPKERGMKNKSCGAGMMVNRRSCPSLISFARSFA